jgi:hypothetical protein
MQMGFEEFLELRLAAIAGVVLRSIFGFFRQLISSKQ